MTLSRGQVIRAHISEVDEPKLFIVVSNNTRNRQLGTVLAVRLTTTPKRPRPSIVEMPRNEAVTGRAVCDDIGPIWLDEVLETITALTPRTMTLIDRGLAAALALTLAN